MMAEPAPGDHLDEVKQVVADAQGQFLAAGMVGGYQQRVLACCPTSVMKAPTRAGASTAVRRLAVTRPGPSYTREHPVSFPLIRAMPLRPVRGRIDVQEAGWGQGPATTT